MKARNSKRDGRQEQQCNEETKRMNRREMMKLGAAAAFAGAGAVHVSTRRNSR
jgi:hypothetical protein